MKIGNSIRRANAAALALVLGVSTLVSVLVPGIAHAAGPFTCNWTGGGDGTSFSDSTNWSGCNSAAPQPADNDDLVFDNTSLGAITILNNDITSLAVGNIQFTGSNTSFGYSLGGNSITLGGNVTDSSLVFDGISATLILSGSHTFSSATQTSYQSLQGSGTINVTGGGETSFDCAGSCQTLSNYTGAISSSNSTIELSTFNTFTSSASVAVSGAAVLDLLDDNGGKAPVSDTYNLPISLGGSGISKLGALNLDGGQDSDVTNVLAGPVTLTSDVQVTASGDNTLNMTGAVTYGGHTLSSVGANVTTITVGSGVNQSGQNPVVGNNVVLSDDGTVGNTTINSGGTLMGGGAVGNLSVNSGGIVAPGHSPGCLTTTGNLTQSGTYQAQLGGTTACSGYDQLIVTGNVTLSGTLDVSLFGGFVPQVGQTFEIVNNQGSQAVSGTFSGLAEGDIFTVSGHVFKVSYKGGDGNDVVLTVVATPATPNTGFAFIGSHPLVTLLGTTLAAAGILLIARQNGRLASARIRRQK